MRPGRREIPRLPRRPLRQPARRAGRQIRRQEHPAHPRREGPGPEDADFHRMCEQRHAQHVGEEVQHRLRQFRLRRHAHDPAERQEHLRAESRAHPGQPEADGQRREQGQAAREGHRDPVVTVPGSPPGYGTGNPAVIQT
ncbi:hypothetical protein SBRY_20946 [Actinacidiphila bryophytorum]|uniref:Uncharacterized protein n=1 Tax=Actinacidiphila bryophytorum TaxID=1436133 RepID=A0A9W4E8A0_9ACTN|nr:hypothetical protein SBRY_20946 [Actinacidiphila bryophytorum]